MTFQKILTRDFILCFLAQFAFTSVFHILIPTLPIYLSRLGSSEVEIGVLIGIFSFSSLLLRPLVGRALIKILEKSGFKVIRQKGSHVIMINDRKTRIVIPVHPGKDIKPGLTRAILREAGISREKFLKILKEK